MKIGIDFDNTIVSYDRVFHKVALELSLITDDIPVSKNDIRDYLREIGEEDEWTKLQGVIYGTRMNEADPFQGVSFFFRWCKQHNIPVYIISHKTKHPYIGPKHDLHIAAMQWLELKGFFKTKDLGLYKERVFFEPTKADKIKRIIETGCTHFIDDLPELLLEPTFPKEVICILFDPNNKYPLQYPFQRVSSWDEILEKFLFSTNYEPVENKNANNIEHLAIVLAQKTGLNGTISLRPIDCGRNNRVYQMNIDSKKFLIKSYFHCKEDLRDRLGNEYSFISFAWEHGLRSVPQPINFDRDHFIGLYEFIEGKRLEPGEVNEDFVHQALKFYCDLNSKEYKPDTYKLPEASEACFSISDHIALVDHRINRLKEIKGDDALTREARKFITRELDPAWKRIIINIQKEIDLSGLAPSQPISIEERCLSPSDFGFHNAILEKNGILRFIDFEYAGLDDPAKMVCDFFCQPAVPVPFEYFPTFIDVITKGTVRPEVLRDRIKLLLPLYQLKWCCIMLNEFLPIDAKRRHYALNNIDQRKIQLDKAKKRLKDIIRK